MIDPILSLSISIHSNRGVYALLLGSGISRAAGIPTGWEIVMDLVRKIALLKREDCEPDPAAWYKRTFGKDPDYSELLDELAKSPTERSQLLRSYFEPTPEEKEQGKKIPTEAHKAIANMAAQGYIRVFLTMNFDRLLEETIAGEGITPIVISTPDAAEGAIPLIHSRCTVIKLHGDYLDTRIKNTTQELASYDKKIDDLLDRIFDEFGLVVCGWSAEWDTALRAAMERCKSRRFLTYWTTLAEPEAMAKRLIELRGAQVISIRGANDFFKHLRDNVLSLETFDRPHPLSAKVAVATLKRYIAEERHIILLHDLISEETERVHEKVVGPEYPSQGVTPDADTIPARARFYETTTDTLLQLVIHGCYWGDKQHEKLWLRAIERLANPEGDRAGYNTWLEMRRYPALLLLYGGGMASLASSRYETLLGLLTKTRITEDGKEMAAVIELNPPSVMDQKVGQLLPNRERQFTPLSNHIRDLLLPKLKELVPREELYEKMFDRFEYILAIVFGEYFEREKSRFWCPIGRFGWKYRNSGRGISIEIANEIELQKEKWPCLAAGICGGSIERLLAIKSQLDDIVRKLPWY